MPSHAKPIDNAAVAAVFQGYPPDLRRHLMALRQLIFDTAAATAGVGPLVETLKWGVPSYLTEETKSGTTIRIDAAPANGRYGLYVHCQANLIDEFRAMYPTGFAYDGNRAILFDKDTPFDREKIRHFIALALTYKLSKKKRDRR